MIARAIIDGLQPPRHGHQVVFIRNFICPSHVQKQFYRKICCYLFNTILHLLTQFYGSYGIFKVQSGKRIFVYFFSEKACQKKYLS
jgi:hypothetical protein